MSALYTLAYPTLSAADAGRLEAFRRLHDPHHEIVAAHFTMVFACSGMDERTYIEHIASVSRASSPISFSCRYAMLGSDDKAERGYVYLVPDEGYSEISRLHDALYSGPLSSRLRLDIPFVPHITLGSSANRSSAKRLCDELNASDPTIRGSIMAISVAAFQDGKISNLAEFSLCGINS
jgi:2'-5' RNA ligase